MFTSIGPSVIFTVILPSTDDKPPHLLDHEPGPDLVEELVVVLDLGPLVLARDLHHVGRLEADRKMQAWANFSNGQNGFAKLTDDAVPVRYAHTKFTSHVYQNVKIHMPQTWMYT